LCIHLMESGLKKNGNRSVSRLKKPARKTALTAR
jgi:hypothetical protein